ncbi:MAG: helix-turn-helix transcriptional regulator [Clostridia bacterium]|nr:helix-turn-helix transcriptional regulator [Clostridia bacterium]
MYMFKDNLRMLRKLKNLTQQEFATKLNVSFKTVSHWEMGYSEPSLSLLIKIKEILNASYEELLD